MILPVLDDWRQFNNIILYCFTLITLLKWSSILRIFYFIWRDRPHIFFSFFINVCVQRTSTWTTISLYRFHIFVFLFFRVSIIVCAILRNKVFSIIIELIVYFFIQVIIFSLGFNLFIFGDFLELAYFILLNVWIMPSTKIWAFIFLNWLISSFTFHLNLLQDFFSSIIFWVIDFFFTVTANLLFFSICIHIVLQFL